LVTGDIVEPAVGEREEDFLLPPLFLFLQIFLVVFSSFEMGKKKRYVALRRGELDKKICRKKKRRREKIFLSSTDCWFQYVTTN